MMKFQLLKGSFSKQEALNVVTQMVEIKIKFQENKIKKSDNEEDIKMRENRIKQLQKDLYEARAYIEQQPGAISLQSEITI